MPLCLLKHLIRRQKPHHRNQQFTAAKNPTIKARITCLSSDGLARVRFGGVTFAKPGGSLVNTRAGGSQSPDFSAFFSGFSAIRFGYSALSGIGASGASPGASSSPS
jgi:hypothetical protein